MKAMDMLMVNLYMTHGYARHAENDMKFIMTIINIALNVDRQLIRKE